MEKIVEQGLLYDFYGELLTEHQKQVYEDAVYNDLSLLEIADEYNISKQGVHDILKRCTRILEDYESKLHMIEKTDRIRTRIESLLEDAGREDADADFLKESILSAAKDITEELS